MLTDRLGLLHDVADAVASALQLVDDWGESGVRAGQYIADVHTDEAALRVLRRAGVGVLSEESGSEGLDRDLVVIVDPLDGSTNASRGVPWYATALCMVDADGPVAALVVNQASGVRYWAEREGGAFRGGEPIAPSACRTSTTAIVGLSGPPPAALRYGQFRALGAAALDLCLVASGVLDGYVDSSHEAHGAWDYAASALICAEAGASIVDAWDRDLFPLSHAARRTPVAAATPELLAELVAARQATADRPPH